MGASDFWGKLSSTKLDWAYEAQRQFVQSIQNEDIRRLYLSGESSDIFVAVFGPSQVGKTSLILQLIGVDHCYVDYVGKLLRAGRPEGKSATATSTIYMPSPDDYFSIRFPGMVDVMRAEEQELESVLAELRQRVETDRAMEIGTVEIGIPLKYFAPEREERIWVTIVDLPGIHSSSPEEHRHVLEVIHHYVPRANLILLVNEANQLSSFKKFGVELIDKWRVVPEKFRIVLTHSVSLRSMRKKLSQADVDAQGYREHFHQQFQHTIPGYPIANIGLYPLEYGRTWNRFMEDMEPTGRIGLQEMMNTLFGELRKDINQSANVYSQIRMNYKLFTAIEETVKKYREQRHRRYQRLAALKISIDSNISATIARRTAIQNKIIRLDKFSTAISKQAKGIPKVGDPPPLGGGDRSRKRLKSYINKVIDKLYTCANEVYQRHYDFLDKLVPCDSFPRDFILVLHQCERAKLNDLARPLMKHLDEYWIDAYSSITTNWEKDSKKAEELAKELRELVQVEVQLTIRKEWDKVISLLNTDINRSRVTIDSLAQYQRSLTLDMGRIEKQLAAFIDRSRAHFSQLRLDLKTAQSFRQFMEKSFQTELHKQRAYINAPVTPRGERGQRLLFTMLLWKEYDKLKERA